MLEIVEQMVETMKWMQIAIGAFGVSVACLLVSGVYYARRIGKIEKRNRELEEQFPHFFHRIVRTRKRF